MAESKVVDLRSDTVTHPTDEMRAAMAAAEVGDDVYGDDPTVNALEAAAAATFGKDAALFVPSGTMGNLLSVLTWCDRRGSEMIVGDESHIHFYEVGGSAVVGGVHSRVVRTQPDGTLLLADIEACVRPENDHFPSTVLVCLENTHNRCGGAVLPAEYIDSVAALCKSRGLKLHLDGARICNAAVAQGVSLARLCAGADSVSVCLSKGLSAPVGSILVGPREFIRRARRYRKMLGGGMRQAGVLAAAARIALESMVARLADDHRNAKALATGIAAMPGLACDPHAVQTNIVYFQVEPAAGVPAAARLVAALAALGVPSNATGPHTVRFVTHRMVTDDDVPLVLERLRAALATVASA